MSRRERILLIVGSTLVVLLLFYYYVYSPRQAEYRALREQLAERTATLERMEATARLAPQLEAEHAQLQATIAQLESKLPTSKETPVLLVQLEDVTKSLKIALTSIKPSALEAPGAPQPAQAGGQPAPKPVAGSYLRYPVRLVISADYAKMLRLLARFRDFPRLIVVRKITVAPREVPNLTTTLDVETFVLPKEAR